MTSDEIKDVAATIKSGSRSLTLDEMRVLFTGEIAYQLAKLNEHFVYVDSCVFGVDREGTKNVRTNRKTTNS